MRQLAQVFDILDVSKVAKSNHNTAVKHYAYFLTSEVSQHALRETYDCEPAQFVSIMYRDLRKYQQVFAVEFPGATIEELL